MFRTRKLMIACLIVISVTLSQGFRPVNGNEIQWQEFTVEAERGSQLKVTIFPVLEYFKPGTIYSYTFNLTVQTFGDDVDKLDSFHLYLQVIDNSEQVAYAKEDSDIVLDSIGAQEQVAIDLQIPSARKLSLKPGEELNVTVQWKIKFNEDVQFSITDPTTDEPWALLEEATISNLENTDVLTIILTGVLIIFPVGIVVLVLKLRKRSENPPYLQ